jgi:hypothetical protein
LAAIGSGIEPFLTVGPRWLAGWCEG